jgi:hypothetical protein
MGGPNVLLLGFDTFQTFLCAWSLPSFFRLSDQFSLDAELKIPRVFTPQAAQVGSFLCLLKRTRLTKVMTT